MADVTLVIKARNEAQAALASVAGDLRQVHQAAGSVGTSLQQTGTALRGVGTGLSIGVTAPVAALGTAAVLSAADFEQAMNVMQQVTGATQGQMAGLQQQALELGAATSFSAGEAAAAMLELAKAGLSADQVAGAIGGTLDLAAAGGLGLAQAAEISANAVNVFGLNASDSTMVANMLAAAANASSVEVTDLAQGMQMAGAVFASSGQSIDDLTTALALMGNAGIKGSDAGTSLKVMLMRLTAPTDEAVKIMNSLGVSVYDAEGSMRALPDVLADLQQALYGTNAQTVTHSNLTAEQAERMDYLKSTIEKTQRQLADYQSGIAGVAQSETDKVVAVDRLNRVLAAAQQEYAGLAAVGGTTSTVMRTLTQEQRTQALTALFGADAIRAANVLLAQGEEGWSEMSAAVGEAGAATEVAGARMRGIKGAIEYVRGSIDSFMISTVLPFADSISGALRSVADAVTAFGRLPTPVKNAALAMMLAAAAVGPLLIGLGMVAGAIGSALPVLAAVGGALAALASPIGLVLALVAALGAAWATNFLGIRDVTMPVVDAVVAAFSRAHAAVLAFGASQTWSRLTATLTQAFASIGAALAGAFRGEVALPDLAGKVQAELGRVAGAIQSALAGADFGALRDALARAFDVGEFDIAALGGRLANLRDRVVAAVTAVDWAGSFSAAVETANGLRDQVLAWVTGKLNGIDWSILSFDLAGLIGRVTGALQAIDWSTVNPLSVFLPLVGRLVPGVGPALSTAKWVVSSEQFAGLVASVREAIAAIDWGVIGEALAGLALAAHDAILGLDWSVLGETATTVRDAVQGLFDGIDIDIQLPTLDTGALTAGIAQVRETLAPAFERLQAALGTLPASLEALKPHIEGLVGAFGSLMTAIQPVLNALGQGLVMAAVFGTNVLAAAISALPGIVGPMIDQVTSTINTIATTVTGVSTAVAAIAAGDWAAAWEALKGIVTGFETFLTTTWTNVTTMVGSVGGALGEAVTNTLTDLGFTAAAEQVQALIDGIATLTTNVQALFTGDWSLFGEEGLALIWPPLPDLSALTWPALPAWSWPELPAWTWPALPTFDWPDLPQWTWPTLPVWSWPSFPTPDWVQGFIDALNGFNPFGLLGGQQLGTSYAAGGWSWVGEAGPELVRLPRGAEVIPNRKVQEAAPGLDGGVTVSVGQMVVQNEMDIYSMAYRLRDVLRRL